MAVIYLLRRLRQTAVHERDTFELYSDTAVADVAVNLSASESFYTGAILTGFTSGTGSVILTGTLLGSTVSHTHVFSGNYRTQNTVQQFDTITRIQTSGLVNEAAVGTLTLEKTSRSGQPKESRTLLGTKKCRVISARLGEIVEVTGGTALNSAKIQLWPKAGVLRNDILTVDDKVWAVKAIRPIYDQRGTRAYDEAIVFSEGQA